MCTTYTANKYTIFTNRKTITQKLPANIGDTGDAGSIPGSRRFPGEGNGNPFQYSCLGNSMDKGVWWATVHRVTRVGHFLKFFSFETWGECMVPSGLFMSNYIIFFNKEKN